MHQNVTHFPLTRDEIECSLSQATTVEHIKTIIKNYIYMREYEHKYIFLRSLLSLVTDQRDFSRDKKIEKALFLLISLNQGDHIISEHNEGLLGRIYQRYFTIAFPEQNPLSFYIADRYQESLQQNAGLGETTTILSDLNINASMFPYLQF